MAKTTVLVVAGITLPEELVATFQVPILALVAVGIAALAATAL